jgi:hypothetical protein
MKKPTYGLSKNAIVCETRKQNVSGNKAEHSAE